MATPTEEKLTAVLNTFVRDSYDYAKAKLGYKGDIQDWLTDVDPNFEIQVLDDSGQITYKGPIWRSPSIVEDTPTPKGFTVGTGVCERECHSM